MNDLAGENTIFLDYAKADNPAEIDRGIRETIKGVRLSILTMGLGLARMKSEGLFKKLKFRTMSAYVDRLCEETKMDRSNIYNWLSIGEAYSKYQRELELIGFSDEDGPTKLPYLERALAVGEKEEVFSNLKNMSQREFSSFAKGGLDESSRDGISYDTPHVLIKGNVVYIQGKRAIIVNKNLGRKTTNYLMKVIHVSCEALEKGGYFMPVFLRNKKETKRFNLVYDRIMGELRKST